MSAPAIRFEGVSFSYPGRPVLRDASFEVAAGAFASVIGPNGGGKTTLLRLALGLLRPDSGRIEVLGTAPEQARPRIGYTPQRAELDPDFPVNVLDVVLMGRLDRAPLLGPYRRSDREAALRALEAVDLAPLARRHFSELSGGQRQRVLIARALVGEPELLLLDEPTVGLDLASEQKLYELLRELNRRMTVVVVSHDVGFVSRMVDQVICVRGRVLSHPTAELTGGDLQEIYGEDYCVVRHDLISPSREERP